MPTDHFNLDRFVTAQNVGGDYERALRELRQGSKRSHWMWYIFPQIEGLGYSGMARRYAISSLDEARAYLAHPVLGPRLREVSETLLTLDNPSPQSVFGSIDAIKLRSSMTLFQRAEDDAGETSVFGRVLDAYFDGQADAATLERL